MIRTSIKQVPQLPLSHAFRQNRKEQELDEQAKQERNHDRNQEKKVLEQEMTKGRKQAKQEQE